MRAFKCAYALWATLALASQLPVIFSQSNGTGVLQVHGSGDGVAAYEINKVMDLLESRTKPLVYLTFRACGTSAAQAEFLGQAGTSLPPSNDFGMGDIPLDYTQYNGLANASAVPLQVPFLLAKVSFFSTVPASATGTAGLYLSACTLAQIYSGLIKTWDHAAVLGDNPGMTVPAGQPLRAYKLTGADAATRGITHYLNISCLASWAFGTTPTLDNVVPSSVLSVADTAGMLSALNASDANAAWSLGYIDSHEGLQGSLSEVTLMNRAQTKLTSSQADSAQVATALAVGTYPPIDQDWSWVSVMNNPAATSWPIVVASYFYLRANSTFLGQAGGLLQAFLTLALSDEVQAIMTEKGLVSLSSATRSDLLSQLNQKLALAPGYPPFSFENSSAVQPVGGQANYVVSSLRTRFSTSELWDHEAEIAAEVALLRSQMADITKNLSVAQQVRDQLYQATQVNAQNAANIQKVQKIAVAGVVLAVLIAIVALTVGAVYIAKTRAIASKYSRIMTDWMPGKQEPGPGDKMLSSTDRRF